MYQTQYPYRWSILGQSPSHPQSLTFWSRGLETTTRSLKIKPSGSKDENVPHCLRVHSRAEELWVRNRHMALGAMVVKKPESFSAHDR